MEIRIVSDIIRIPEIQDIAKEWYGDMIKGVVDVEREIIALGGEYHMDANAVLIENGSHQDAVWGFNIHLQKPREGWIDCRSLINIRPRQNNRSILIEDKILQEKIRTIVNKRIL